jgi:release factor glutamine methyltransferase
LNAVFRDAVERLRAAGVDNPRLDARVLWEFAQNPNPPLEGGSKFAQQISGRGPGSALNPSPKNPADSSTLPQGAGGTAAERFESLIARRVSREPVAYITGHKEFWSLDFDVGPGALIPRPETETLVESVLTEFPDRAAPLGVLDLGTGTGCLLLSVLSEFPNARGMGVDASPHALEWARRNAGKLGLADRCNLLAGNWGDDLSDRVDVILSNPPYIRTGDIARLAPEIGLFEPHGALDGGRDGLDAYRALGPEISRLLKFGGLAFLEMGEGQDAEIVEILAHSGLGTRKIATDLAGIGRCVIAEHRARPEKTVGSPAPNR